MSAPAPSPAVPQARFAGANVVQVGVVLAMLAGAAVLASVDSVAGARWLPGCVFHEVTGLHCPGCGATRALHALVHGDLLHAARCNLLLLAVLVGVPAWPMLRRRLSAASQARLAWSAVIVFAAFFLLRNLPFLPGLAPPQ